MGLQSDMTFFKIGHIFTTALRIGQEQCLVFVDLALPGQLTPGLSPTKFDAVKCQETRLSSDKRISRHLTTSNPAGNTPG